MILEIELKKRFEYVSIQAAFFVFCSFFVLNLK